MASGKERPLIEFLNFSSEPCNMLSYYDHLKMLFKKLKFIDDSMDYSFWPHRNEIAKNTSNLIIAVDKNNNNRQLGFCYFKIDRNLDIIYIKMIQSFEKRIGCATAILDHLSDTYDEYDHFPSPTRPLILVEKIASQAVGFWNAYFEHNKRSGKLKWYYNPNGGEGPLLVFNEDLTYGTFVVILNALSKALYMDVTPAEKSNGGISFSKDKVLIAQILFPYRPSGRMYPKPTWETDWKDSKKVLALKDAEYKTIYKKLDTHELDEYDLNEMIKVFAQFHIDMKYIF